MKYTKPEVSALGDAATVIQSGAKPASPTIDSVNPSLRSVLQPAYDLDE